MVVSFLVRFLIDRFDHLLRYNLSGLISTGINYGALYLFFGMLSLQVLASASIAFALSTGANFLLQKYWTYRDGRAGFFRRQFVLYFAMGLAMLGVNDAVMYLMSDLAHANYILSQIGATIAVSAIGIAVTGRIFRPAYQTRAVTTR